MTTYYLQQKNGKEIETLATCQATNTNEASKVFTQKMRNDRKFRESVEPRVYTKWTKIFREGYQK
jgi:hypothetical protein